FFRSLTLPPPLSSLFPYTTLFRSVLRAGDEEGPLQQGEFPACPRGHRIAEPACDGRQVRVDGDLVSRLSLCVRQIRDDGQRVEQDRKSTRLNSSHRTISYAVFCLK